MEVLNFILIIFGLGALFLFSVHQSIKADVAKADAKDLASEQELQAILEEEMKKPMSFIKITTFDGIIKDDPISPRIEDLGFSNKKVVSSKYRAERIIRRSYERGYFEIQETQIPVRNIKSTRIQE